MAGKSPEEEHPVKTYGLAAHDSSGVLSPFKFSRRATLEDDVRFKVLYCGICHTDLHFAKNEWGISTYPLVPGHEIVGEVTEVGGKVTKVKVGDKVGVGCLVGPCRTCDNCRADLDNYCPKMVLTYASPNVDGTITYGGYSNEMVCNEHFIVRFPENLPLDGGAPLLCAGITVYSPMKYYGFAKPGSHIAVNGLGGLGHVAVKFAKAMGAKVTVISTSEGKKDDALNRLGADAFLLSSNPEALQAATGTFDGILNTISAKHAIIPLLGLLKSHGKLVLLGAPPEPLDLHSAPLLMGRKMVAGSSIGGLKETQEMLDFAGKHNITADIELISADNINTALERLAKGDVRYRFVLDVAKTLKAP
uniref:Alcohol dehydrogenase 9 n=1 Tax=Catharanthus roseus TaxID=4058 RepID=ADH9_CATRO|nr:RecName: Full=Alcohol dehydrogenase 9; Short=CrADH9 [Catharanthus roseus]AHK60844.1 CrADH9 [Catharanthus roseus]